MNSLMMTGEVGTEIVRYLPDQDAFRVAGVSRSFRNASYSGRIWIERRLPSPDSYTRFFLPPAGAGGMVETILHTYRYLSSSYGGKLPSYADRQLLLANKYPHLAGRYPHVVPGVAIPRARVPTERWMRQHVRPLACKAFIYCCAGIILYFLSKEGRYVYVLSSYLICISPSLVLGILARDWRLPLVSFLGIPVAGVHIIAEALEDRVNARLPSIAGRVAQLVKAVQLVTQRALQPLTCKVRVMIRRYWSS